MFIELAACANFFAAKECLPSRNNSDCESINITPPLFLFLYSFSSSSLCCEEIHTASFKFSLATSCSSKSLPGVLMMVLDWLVVSMMMYENGVGPL